MIQAPLTLAKQSQINFRFVTRSSWNWLKIIKEKWKRSARNMKTKYTTEIWVQKRQSMLLNDHPTKGKFFFSFFCNLCCSQFCNFSRYLTFIFCIVYRLKSKQEAMRQHMMQKMQNLMQAHYNETLQVTIKTLGAGLGSDPPKCFYWIF